MKTAKYPFGTVVRCHGDFVGRISIAYENFDAVLDTFAVPRDWFELQETPPSSKSQIFYAVDGNGPGLSRGAVLAGEDDIVLVSS